MSKMFRPDISPSNFSFPYDISLFNETLQALFSLFSQILGLQDYKLVTKIMLGTMCLVIQSTKEFSLSFDQYLVENISYQLEHFNSDGKVFNYQTLLMLMVIIENLDELKQIEPINFSYSTNLSQRNATISFFTFVGSVMPTLHKLIFGSFMLRISKDLKLLLQNPMETVGDWFCFENYIVIKVYGFEREPFRLPRFISRSLFALEFLRQRLVAENDNFIKQKKVSSMKFNFTLEPFMVKSVSAISVIDQIMKCMSFDTDKALRYDPNRVLHQRRLDVNLSGYEVEHDEVLVALANTNLFEQVEIGDGSSNNSERNSLGKDTCKQAEVHTSLKVEKSPKRHFADTMDMDEDVATKRPRMFEPSKEIVDIQDDDERSINKGKATIVEEESQEQSQSVPNTDRTITNPAIVKSSQDPAMVLQRFTLSETETSQVSSQEELVKYFSNERNKSANDNHKLMQQIRKVVLGKISLLAIREVEGNVFRIPTSDKEGVSQVKIQMDQVGLPGKINFHKQASEILYSNLLKSYLSKTKLEEKVVKLEEQIKRENVASKGWKTQVKKLEADLVNLGSVPAEKKSNKNLIEEKDKLIESLQKKLKGVPSDHPQTEEIMVIQTENDQLKKEVMELKAKVLQVTKEKEDLAKEKDELTSQISIQAPLAIVQPIDANELVVFMAQVSLKDKKISQLVQEKKQLEKLNKERQEKIDRLKGRLMGKEVLKSTQHSLWDLIYIEVSKFWKELRRMEVKKAYIYSALDKHKLATEQLAHLHKTPTERDLMSIKFFKYSSDEAL